MASRGAPEVDGDEEEDAPAPLSQDQVRATLHGCKPLATFGLDLGPLHKDSSVWSEILYSDVASAARQRGLEHAADVARGEACALRGEGCGGTPCATTVSAFVEIAPAADSDGRPTLEPRDIALCDACVASCAVRLAQCMLCGSLCTPFLHAELLDKDAAHGRLDDRTAIVLCCECAVGEHGKLKLAQAAHPTQLVDMDEEDLGSLMATSLALAVLGDMQWDNLLRLRARGHGGPGVAGARAQLEAQKARLTELQDHMREVREVALAGWSSSPAKAGKDVDT